MEERGADTAPRRRGRRAGGEDTREQILAAARAEFAARGYAKASVRGIARRAGVDPGLVRYWYPDGKSELLSASLMHPLVNPARMVDRVLDGPPEGIAARLLTVVLTVWDIPGGPERLQMVLSAAVSGEDGGAIRDYLAAEVFERIAARVGGPDAGLRATFMASQVVGLLVARHVVRIEPLASAPVEQVVAWMAPSLQRYVDGPAPDAASPAHLPDAFREALRSYGRPPGGAVGEAPGPSAGPPAGPPEISGP